MNNYLTILAIIPGVVLVYLVYKMDRIEKEPVSNIIKLLYYGALTTIIAAFLEIVGEMFLYRFFGQSLLTNFLMYFIVVAGAEEGMKYYVFMKKVWVSTDFDYKYDALVYSVSISMGFAIWENINYVRHGGTTVAIARAFCAVPGHAVFALFMGLFLGMARKESTYVNYGGNTKVNFYKRLAILVPMLIHGLYDFLAVSETMAANIAWFVLLMFMYWFAYIIITRVSKDDEYIGY